MGQEQDISSFIEEINTSFAAFKDSKNTDIQGSRAQALEAARKLSAALATPEETVLHHSYEIPPLNLCVRLGVALRLFHTVAAQNAKPIASTELANISNGNTQLIVRVLRILAAAGYVAQQGPDSYISTPLTLAMIKPGIETSVIHRYDFGLPTLAKAPEYYKSADFHTPTDSLHTPFQLAFNTKLGFYEYLGTKPDATRNFQTYMSALQARSLQWCDWFPVQERILDGFDSARGNGEGNGAVLLVDVGGGQGHYIKRFRDTFPNTPGRLILQDLHARKDSEPVGQGIEFIEHNFFDPQPVKGARTYYFHFVFTDWSDAKAQEILRRTVDAMTPGYSKLIINDVILPNENCSWQHAALDIIMMSTFAGFHRSENDFSRLLGECGLEIVKFWHPPGIGDGVVEAVRKE